MYIRAPAPTLWQGLRETFEMLWVAARPATDAAPRVYEALGTHNLPDESGLFVNLGYWADPAVSTLHEASTALAMLLAETAELGRGQHVLDAGFGFGDQDLLWARRFAPARIVGLNPTAFQVEIAQQRVREAGLEGVVDLRAGSATEIPLADSSVDRVVALESAFHFNTRRRFFEEAQRVLRPGGMLATADIILQQGERIGWPFTTAWQMPESNLHDAAEYERQLRESGFEGVEVRSIREQVYAPFLSALGRRIKDPEVVERMNPLLRFAVQPAPWTRSVLSKFDYVVTRAVKR